ncbi:MAG: tyrosine-type recombinase/integrase [Bacillota bacterium]
MKITIDIIDLYLNHCENEKRLDLKTIKAYKIDLQQFYDFIYNIDISKTSILNFIIELQSKYKPRSVKRKVASLKALFNYLMENELILSNPFHLFKVKIKQPFILPKVIPIEILQKIFNYIYSFEHLTNSYSYSAFIASRNIAVCELLFGTGIRISELCSLTIDAVNLQSRHIKIYGKGAKERLIQIPNDTIITALKNYYILKHKVKKSSDFFFINRSSERLSEQSVRFMLKKLTKTCGIQTNITPHMFRHTFATMLLDDDVDIRHIQHILGHSSITTTQIYTHVSSTKQRDILLTKNPRNKLF